jgi:hypothetical protein
MSPAWDERVRIGDQMAIALELPSTVIVRDLMRTLAEALGIKWDDEDERENLSSLLTGLLSALVTLFDNPRLNPGTRSIEIAHRVVPSDGGAALSLLMQVGPPRDLACRGGAWSDVCRQAKEALETRLSQQLRKLFGCVDRRRIPQQRSRWLKANPLRWRAG